MADTTVRKPDASRLSVFLSHASADKPVVRDLHQRLRRDGFEPWLDEEDLLPGQDWEQEIRKTVRRADVVLVCLSHSSITKEGYVQKEIKLALDVADEKPDGTIFVVPVRLEECEVPERLRQWQWVNYYEKQDYERLVRALRNREQSLNKSPLSQVSSAPPPQQSSLPPAASSTAERTVAPVDKTVSMQHELKSPSQRLDGILDNLIAYVLPLLVAPILQILCPLWATELLSLFSGILLVLTLVLGSLYLRHRKTQRKIIAGAMITTLVLVISALYLLCDRYITRDTVFFIVDASENMQAYFKEVEPRINLLASTVPDNVETGLMVFGGRITILRECDDIASLVAPSPKQTSIPAIDKSIQQLTNLRPQGRGTLQRALLKALTELSERQQELPERGGIKQFVVITSGVDISCGDLDREELEIAADQKDIDFQLTIITIGPVMEEDKILLERFADKYFNVQSPEQVPEVAETAVSEFKGYYGPIRAP
jgi:hypothetical protein